MASDDITIVNTGCCHDCGGRCVLKAHVKDGKIIRFETDNGENPQIRACARGRAYRQRLYSPDRLKYPQRRTGERGEGKFERISWDDALDEVASKLKHIKETYGNSSILFVPGAGNQGMLHGPMPIGLMLHLFGGYTRHWGIPSYEGALFASMATYGTIRTGNSREDLLNSKLVIMWGWNPANTIQDPETSLYLAKVREKGIKIVAVDPRYTDSAATFAHQWIPVRPGTDAAMLIAMAYVIISEDLHNKKFIETHTVGFEKYKNYVLGKEDGEPKTPQWAESITSVSADVIVKLAREYATKKPAALIAGWGPARTAMGEQYSRAANVLTAITGNIGINGGYASGFMRAYSSREQTFGKSKKKGITGKQVPAEWGPIPSGNPVENGALPRKDALYKLKGGTNPTSARIHYTKIYDAILKGRKGGYPADLKMAYVVACNSINQYSNTRLGIKAYKSLESVIVHEQFMTPTAKFADILLPANTFMERSDIAPPWLGSPYYIYLNKAVDSMYESKSDLDISRELAKRLDIQADFFERTEEDLLKGIAASRDDIHDFDSMKKDGVLKIKLPESIVSFKEQIEDPKNCHFPTLSGKIEIDCEHMAELNDPMIPSIPKYIPHGESHDAPKSDAYPLQLLTTHHKTRAHSTWHNVPWMKEIEAHAAWIHPADASARKIAEGDLVDVFNDNGRIRIPAKVTERIMPGVVNVSQGTWYDPNKEGVDLGGCANVLTNDSRSPGGAVAMNSTLVQVELAPDSAKEVSK
ncbi:MAG: molybdopterin-dependent oxidoreductase [Deltaproteobacteria bacterium]|nr:molybdopterin-dependent oxidoreductase [Deltaproteobacteria bacterium]